MTASNIAWIAADWGTTNLRLWAMDADGQALAAKTSPQGMGALKPEEFEPHLVEMTAEWCGDAMMNVIICGMAGARQGWMEAPYQAVPFKPENPGFVEPAMKAPSLRAFILSGAQQSQPADVMRGEETQVAGALAEKPDFDGVILMPGTHSKWARISAGELCHFQSFMTGELFSLIAKSSVLRHSIQEAKPDQPAFDEAVDDAIGQPGRIMAKLFGLRAEMLLHGLAPEMAAGRLSGWLIGLELAGAKPYWLGQEILIIGDQSLAALYQRALDTQSAMSAPLDPERATLAGLHSAWRSLKTSGTLS